MVNVRKMEGDGVTCGFARKEFVFSSPSPYFIDLLFRRFDEKWPSRRPGIVYIVPTGSATVAEFKEVHLSAYNKTLLMTPGAPQKSSSDKGTKRTKPQKQRSAKGTKRTKPQKQRSDKGTKRSTVFKQRSDKGTKRK